jgi:hypothetical protein
MPYTIKVVKRTPMTDFFNTNIIKNHDDIMMLNSWMVEHWDYCMSLPWNTQEQNDELYDLKKSYLCYDV